MILQDHPRGLPVARGLSVARGTTYMAIMVSLGNNQWQPHLVWGVSFRETIIEITSPKETYHNT